MIQPGCKLEITSPRELKFKVGDVFSMKDNGLNIEVRLDEQKRVGDGWLITGEVVRAWVTDLRN